jgi:AraC-like DNA-binding protein/mannose-6-phosphate isomerase-like protein (cupin superfamily)
MSGKGIHQKAFTRSNSFPPVASVYRMFNTVGMPKGHEAHVHPETVEICFVLHGCLEWWLGDSTFPIQSDDVFVALPGQPHGSIDSTLQPCEYYAVHLDPGLFPEELRASLGRPNFGGLYPSLPEAGVLIQQIFQEHEQPDSISPELCKALCVNLIAHLARERRTGGDRQFSSFVRTAQRQLMQWQMEADAVAMAAKALGVSAVWLNRQFRQELGVSPAEWLRSRRIAEAKRLLSVERMGVTEAAVVLGFRSSQYFATAFRRETGVTPSSYRDRQKDRLKSQVAIARI